MTKMIRSFSYIRFAVVMFIFTEVNAATHVGRSFHKRDSLLSRGSEHSEALGSSHNDSKRNSSNVSEVSLVHLMSAERNQRNSYKSSDEHVNIPDKQFLSTNIPREMDIAEVSFSALSPIWNSDTRTLRPTSDHSSAPLIHYHQGSSPPVSSTILGASPSTSNRSEVTSPSSFPPAGTQGVVSTEIPKAHEHRLAFLDKMLENYDKRAWPTYGTGGTPTLVYINIYINSLGSVNAANMEYSMDIYLRQMWHDPRLRLSRFGITEGVTLNGEDITENIWKPDLFFRNVKEANFHKVTVPNKLIKLSPEGNILFSMRLTLKLACHMSFRHYPLDTQRCHIVLGPYAQTMDQVIIEWQENDPIVIEQPLELPEFDVAGFSYSNFTRDIDTGSFSFLRVTFVMVRQNGYHLIQTYMPTFLIVMISWVSCWLNVDATPARVTLGVTTLLTLTTVASGIRTQLPPVSYVKAIDVWIGACSVMVFGALLEFTLVNYLSRSKLRPDEFKRSMNIFHWNKKIHLDHSMDGRMASENEIARNLKRARTVDRVSRVLFPLLFFTFNMIYWPYYLFTPD